MVDARHMEVYTAVFENGRQITETAPAIIDENSFAEYLEQGPCLFIGAGDFKDIAYFEPFYLKEFVATVSKKKMW